MKKLATLFMGGNNNETTADEKNKKKLLEKGVQQWTKKDVSLWLKSLELTDYCKEFEKADITGAELLELTDDDLIKDLKVTKLGHRKRLRKHLEYLVQHHDFLNDDEENTLSDHSNVLSSNSQFVSQQQQFNSSPIGTPPSSITSVTTGQTPSTRSLNHHLKSSPSNLSHQTNGISNNHRQETSLYGGGQYGDTDSVSSSSSSCVNILSTDAFSTLWIKCYELPQQQQPTMMGQQQESPLNESSNSHHNTMILKFNLGNENDGIQNTNSSMNSILSQIPSLEEVKQEILSRLGQKQQHVPYSSSQLQLKYKDEDDDMIALKRDEDFKLCVQQYLLARNNFISSLSSTNSRHTCRYLKLYMSLPSSSNGMIKMNIPSQVVHSSVNNHHLNDELNHSKKTIQGCSINSESEELVEILDGMVEAMIVMTAHDKLIKYVNKATESLLLFTREELIGFNVTKIMPSAYRQHHDEYVDLYCKTGIPKIINKGRIVPVKNKHGKVFDCWLSVSDSTWGNQRAFTGTLKVIYSSDSSSPSSSSVNTTTTRPQVFPFLENMVDGVIIISGNDDIVRYFNKSAEQMFGYSREEVVGQKVGMLVYDERVRQCHNQYVKRYMESGDSHIVGIGRRVEALTKDGKMIPIFLSVNETKWNNGLNGRCFIGTTKLLDQNSAISKYV
ncbi:hypothetical protein FDP41_011816 [Naegleria fowleri]|uniref:SAM domain-containing protein n=1 Tax=Naegleria fowleri TaxID=5763 RepID=A0A6A5C9C7_NAEFO|nr:uncharacterized protein FDP41_011816 [Naegleria fowleri]KAF0981955.1 hypothetical protein FDP41_011816 [Naegleria fowleri]